MTPVTTLALLTVAEEQQPECEGSRDRALYIVIDRAAGLARWPEQAKARLYSLVIEHPDFNGTTVALAQAIQAAFTKTTEEFK